MATIVNDRDVLLQAESPRNIDPSAGKALLLSANPMTEVLSFDMALYKIDIVPLRSIAAGLKMAFDSHGTFLRGVRSAPIDFRLTPISL